MDTIDLPRFGAVPRPTGTSPTATPVPVKPKLVKKRRGKSANNRKFSINRSGKFSQ